VERRSGEEEWSGGVEEWRGVEWSGVEWRGVERREGACMRKGRKGGKIKSA
jgi:hypothetical protein